MVSAEAPPAAEPDSSDLDLSLTGTYRVSFEGIGDMRVDSLGRTYNQNELITHRLAFTPTLTLFKSMELHADVQLATGFLSYDATDRWFVREDEQGRLESFGPPRMGDGAAFGHGRSFADQLALRKLYFTWTTMIGQLRVGRMASDWGLGILANGGDREQQDWGSPRFGKDRNYGDVVNRVMIATRPFIFMSPERWAKRWTAVLGADVVERDERIELRQGDVAPQIIGAVRYAKGDRQLGFYVAHRRLTDRRADTLNVTALDVTGRNFWSVGDVTIKAEGELAWVLGDTTLGRNNAFTGVDPATGGSDPLLVQQLGYVLRAGATYDPLNLGGELELGYASGDSNTNDGFVRNFTFDPDYNPSLILFDQLRAAETVAAAANASDPARVGIPADAVELVPTNGSVTNAIYLKPTIRFAWEDFGVRVAALWAWAEEDVFDPYGSNSDGGGAALNYQGGDGSQRDLGLEFDVGVDYTYRLDTWAEFHASVQGGYLLPGSAFENAEGVRVDPIGMVYGRLMVRWLP